MSRVLMLTVNTISAKYLLQQLLLKHTQKINRNTREIRINET